VASKIDNAMKISLKSFLCVATVAFLGIAVDAADDGGRCSICGKLTMVGGNHLCKPRKKSRSISFSVASKKAESQPESVETKKVVVPQELKPLDGTYATEVISTSSRVWTDETGRKIEATWAHISEDYEHVFLKSVKTKRRLDVSVSQLADADRRYVKDYVGSEVAKSNVWLRGVFVNTEVAEAYRQREKAKAVILGKDSIASKITKLRVFQVLGTEALCWPVNDTDVDSDGPVKYVPSKPSFLVDGDSIQRRFIWCGTYNYETRGNNDRTVHCVTDDPKFAIERVLAYLRDGMDGGKSVPRQPPSDDDGEFTLQGTGSGFFITANGYLITNHHVVEGGRKFAVLTESGLVEAKLITVDRDTDLALLKTEGVRVRPFKLSSRRCEKLATPILTMGFPQPDLQGFDPKVTRGVISGDNGFRGDVKNYQIDATIQPGNSGGPVFNEHGCVIGVAVAGLKVGQAINYCIKKSYLLAFIDNVPECSKDIMICDDCTLSRQGSENVVATLRKSCVLVVNYR